VTPVVFDWASPGTWAAALGGVDAVYLMRPDLEEAPELVSAFVDAAAQVERVVLLSEMGADQLAPRDVATARRGGVRPARRTRDDPAPHVVRAGADRRALPPRPVRDHRRLAMPSAGSAISFIDARDVAAVAVEALLDPRHRGQEYTLSGPRALTLDEVTALITHALSEQVAYVQTQIPEAIEELASMGVGPWHREIYRDLYERVEAGGFAPVTDAVERVTGSAPRTLEAFVAEHAAHWRV
jgi:uncharacterized protein YbjT (DUF2867 family)